MKRSARKDDQSLSFNTAKISSDYPDLADCSEIKAMEAIPPINQILDEEQVESETYGEGVIEYDEVEEHKSKEVSRKEVKEPEEVGY